MIYEKFEREVVWPIIRPILFSLAELHTDRFSYIIY